MTGRTIDLQIFCDKGNESRCQWAMESLKKSMKWDEDVFGLEYDLDLFMIVAVDAFNFGAMENKGLNIFNTSCVLADKSTETDANFMRVEGVVAHEYFHNWTGNRVTCRDWFQLTLKEGLTVFRDQEFSADMNSRPLHRIEDVLDLRNRQFVEDAGPTAHPIKPDRYIQINNFYTSTVYQKGATVIRMIQTLIGNEAFRKGIDKYFELYDGQAVTTEDFVHAMTVASGRDLTQFVRWYHQAGTPEVEVTWKYDAAAKTFALTTKQSCPETADGSPKEPFHFPFNVGLIGPDGKDMAVSLQQGTPHARVDGATAILEVTEPEQTFVFENVAEAPVASVNRNFCAPVKVKAPYTEEESLFLMARDSDSFNRWDSGHELATRLMLGMVDAFSEGEEFVLDPRYKDAYRVILEDSSLDRALKALALALPSEATLAQRQAIIDFDGNHLVREYCSSDLATTYRQLFLDEYDRHHDTGEYVLTPEAVGRRSLKNSCLAYLGRIGDEAVTELAYRQYKEAKNMTDQLAALSVLNNIECSEREEVLNAFYQQWKGDVLVMCKWLGVQALSKLDGTLERVTALKNSDIFDMGIPNLVRALFGSFAMNHVHFNSNDGVGYAFLADNIIELDAINPQIAARLAEGFRRYGKLDSLRKKAMGAELDRILSVGGLSNNTYEMVSKIAGAKKPAGSC